MCDALHILLIAAVVADILGINIVIATAVAVSCSWHVRRREGCVGLKCVWTIVLTAGLLLGPGLSWSNSKVG